MVFSQSNIKIVMHNPLTQFTVFACWLYPLFSDTVKKSKRTFRTVRTNVVSTSNHLEKQRQNIQASLERKQTKSETTSLELKSSHFTNRNMTSTTTTTSSHSKRDGFQVGICGGGGVGKSCITVRFEIGRASCRERVL